MAITIGTQYKYSNNVIIPYNCLKLDSTHFVGVYSKYGIRGTVSGTDITYGSEQTVDSYSQKIGADVIDSTHYVTAYYDSANYNVGRAYIATISGDTITAGNTYEVRSSDARMVGENYNGITVLDSTHFIIAYGYYVGGVYKGGAKLGTISDGVISFGAEATFNDAYTSNINVKKLDSTHFVISYTDDGNSSYGTSIIGTYSGTTLSFGSEYVFNSASSQHINLEVIDSSNFIVSYKDVGNSNYGTSVIGTISSGNVISYGSKSVFNSGSTSIPNVVKIDSSNIMVFYIDASDSNKLKCNTGSYSGNSITFGTEADIISNSLYPKATLLDTGKVALIYRWEDLGGKGYSNILTATFSTGSSKFFQLFN